MRNDKCRDEGFSRVQFVIFHLSLVICQILFCALASPSAGPYLAGADAAGEQVVLRYLSESARKDAVLSMAVDYTEPGKERLHLEFTWMRKIKQGLASHLLRIETPESEKGKLLLVREKPGGGADYLAYRPGSVLKKKVRITGAREYKFKALTVSVQELIGGELLMRSWTETVSALNLYSRAPVIRTFFRSEEHTTELQSHHDLVCRPLR